MNENGWILLHKSLFDWEWWDDHNTTRVFITCLLMANWKDKQWKGVTIKRGSFVTSLQSLSKKTGVSIMSIRTSLSRLKSTHELTSKTSNKYTVISINKYDEYQPANTQTNKQLTNKQQTTNNNIKNNKRIIKKREIDTLTQSDLETIATDYQVPISFVISKLDDLKNYCASNGKTYKDYRAALRNWVKKDSMSLRKEQSGRSKIAFIEV